MRHAQKKKKISNKARHQAIDRFSATCFDLTLARRCRDESRRGVAYPNRHRMKIATKPTPQGNGRHEASIVDKHFVDGSFS